MKTLRDEGVRLIGCTDEAEEFFHVYGDWQVARGELCIATNRRGPLGGPLSQEWQEVTVWDGEEYTSLGVVGGHVELIKPPLEEDGDETSSLRRQLLQTASDKRDAQHRADKYEKALRDIADVRTELLGVAREMKRKAKEALDE